MLEIANMPSNNGHFLNSFYEDEFYEWVTRKRKEWDSVCEREKMGAFSSSEMRALKLVTTIHISYAAIDRMTALLSLAFDMGISYQYNNIRAIILYYIDVIVIIKII